MRIKIEKVATGGYKAILGKEDSAISLDATSDDLLGSVLSVIAKMGTQKGIGWKKENEDFRSLFEEIVGFTEEE